MKIYHNSRIKEYREPFGAVTAGSVVRIAIDIESEKRCRVFLHLDHEGNGSKMIPVIETDRLGNKAKYSVSINIPEKTGLLWYFFRVETEDNETFYYGNNEDRLGGEGMLYSDEAPAFQITVYKKTEVPSWYKNSIVYQIFPDRFDRDSGWHRRTDIAISDRNRRIASNVLDADQTGCQQQIIEEDWSRPAYYIKDEEGNVKAWPFYGGSLKGIEDRLDYLKSLGVGAIYLNPVFEAVSNHRYDVSDYMNIDPILGSEDDFKDLIDAANDRGISIILDGVFSHQGADSIYFDKYGNYGGKGAYVNRESNYRFWYTFDENEEHGYKCWWNVPDLPEVNENNSFYRQIICGENGVLRKWSKLGVKGWRLDVADELPDTFIKNIRECIKNVNKENILLGEVWEDASNKISYDCRREYLLGDELDSTMNYPLRQILLDFINYTITSGQASERILSLKENYPPENFYGSLNIIGSHDRKRILSMMAVEQDHDAAVNKVRILSTLQYTLPGVPCIYYGDEIGMTGGDDPENRDPYTWDRSEPQLAYHYRMLGLLYEEHPVLKEGSFELLNGQITGISDDVLAFVRYNEDERIIFLANRSYNNCIIDLSELHIFDEHTALDLLGSYEITDDKIELERLSCKVLLLKDKLYDDKEKTRAAGVICHISSLPSGKLGRSARDFVDWLDSIGMKIWQILPLNPNGQGNCPYNSYSAFAGNPDFIDQNELPGMARFRSFYMNNRFWLDDYTDYVICEKLHIDTKAEPKRAEKARMSLLKEQYYFDEQWKLLRRYANSKGIKIMGDIPIYVSADSADVRGNKDIFLLDPKGRLRVHAGVPPDDFTDEGQNWGLALYDWGKMKENGYDWWIKRILQCAERYDIVRLDHFRGFSEYFAIPDGKTPAEGYWQHGPGIDFFRTVKAVLDENNCDLEIIAEDLGALDSGVMNLLDLAGFPGMNIYQFNALDMHSMSEKESENRVFYTGTHDNQTLVGWIKEKSPHSTETEIYHTAVGIIEWLFMSNARYTMLQLQDVFLLDDSARMNIPGVAIGNWKWRIPAGSIQEAYPEKFDNVSNWYKNLIIKSNR